jgi:LacI family transcriptional regulator
VTERAPRATIRAVAERAGVAMSTVSRVMNGHMDVSDAMRERIEEAVRDLGYRPDMLAQGMRTRKTRSVGFTVSDISNPVFAAAVTGAERRLRRAGYSLLLTSSENDPELDLENIRSLTQRCVDGFILGLADERHVATGAMLAETRVPIVLLDRDMPAGVRASRVVFDHRAGMTRATQHLLDLGHREIALIVGGPQRPASERREAVVGAVAAAGCRCVVYEGPFSIAYGERAAHEILDAEPDVSAIIAGGNVLMHGALRSFRARGLRLGSDLSFVGCDDVLVAEVHAPQIAVVRRDMGSMGLAAADLLLERMTTPAGTREITLPTEFVLRPSCGPLAARLR